MTEVYVVRDVAGGVEYHVFNDRRLAEMVRDLLNKYRYHFEVETVTVHGDLEQWVNAYTKEEA